MIIYIRDPRAPDKYTPWGRHKKAYDAGTGDVKYSVIDQKATIPAVVKAIINSAGGAQRSIWLLIIVAHGNSGSIQIGTGMQIGQCQHFAALRPYFTPGGRGIEIHSCGTASDTRLVRNKGTSGFGPGYRFLAALAKAANVPVAAAVNSQYEDAYGNFEGPWIKVQPNGNAASMASPI